jgi:hypothetical protein
MDWAAKYGHVDVFEFLYKAKMTYSDNVHAAAMITTMKENCARTIQRNCENWLWKPMCRDGNHGIHMKMLMDQMKLK